MVLSVRWDHVRRLARSLQSRLLAQVPDMEQVHNRVEAGSKAVDNRRNCSMRY
ncbi:hypothetical protein I4000191A8_16370 [Clostridia bacterium i40-0019-1A8]